MSYMVEVFDHNGLRVGYAWRGRLTLTPSYYPHPSAARAGAAAYLRHQATTKTPAHHCFINKWTRPNSVRNWVLVQVGLSAPNKEIK